MSTRRGILEGSNDLATDRAACATTTFDQVDHSAALPGAPTDGEQPIRSFLGDARAAIPPPPRDDLGSVGALACRRRHLPRGAATSRTACTRSSVLLALVPNLAMSG